MSKEQIEAFINEQLSNYSIKLVDANQIYVPPVFPDMNEFWVNHGYNKQHYFDLITQLYLIYIDLFLEKSLDFNNEIVQIFFTFHNTPTVRTRRDGTYQLATDGMHRILAAQEFKATIPVRIMNERTNKIWPQQ